MKSLRVLLLGCSAVLLIAAACEPSLAQCAMCGASVQNSTDAEAASKTLDLAAMILLVPPVTIFAGLFGVFYRFRNVQGGRAAPMSQEEPALGEEPPPKF
jgi:heme/copper-type cytochrome/quinol oxidase subunit 3